MNLNKMKLNKYYLAADRIAEPISRGENDNWTHSTEKQAIDHAKKILKETPSKSCVVIVEITHVITRKDCPIEILKVK